MLAAWYDQAVIEGTPVLSGSLFGWLFGVFGQHAVTINGSVHLTPQAPELASERGIALLGHELYHVVDQRRVGWWRYLGGYVAHWRPTHICHGRRHPYEAPAYARQAEVRAALEG